MSVFGRLALAVLAVMPLATEAFALPIGFGRTQGDLEYDEIKTDDFIVYHDRRAPHEARAILDALNAAKPKLQGWIGAQRSKALPVVLSSTTSNASFANFITDAIELQTLARGGRDLAWHEYTHSTMYRHFDNLLGPAGSIIHLPWMPAWWIEGLAEAVSVSGGSDEQYGIERHFAINGGWPTYDKLHSLYDGTRFSGIGYAVSGGFVSYILRTYDANKLPQMLESFYKYSMPWWWPWSVVPFADFMPMDEALREWTGRSGAELYEDYKRDATAYWRGRTDLPYITEKDYQLVVKPLPVKREVQKGLHPGQAMSFNSSYFFQERGGQLFFLSNDDGNLGESAVGWRGQAIQKTNKVRSMPKGSLGPRAILSDAIVFLRSDSNENLDIFRDFFVEKNGREKRLFRRTGYVSDIFEGKDRIFWLEERLEAQQLCSVLKTDVLAARAISGKKISCHGKVVFPQTLTALGQRAVPGLKGRYNKEIWFRSTEETLVGDRHSITIFDTDILKTRSFVDPGRGKPMSLAFNAQGLWIAYAEQTGHFLRHFDNTGRCADEWQMANMVDRLFNSQDAQLTMSLWRTDGVEIVRAKDLPAHKTVCRVRDEPNSPMQLALRYPSASFKEILLQRHPWKPSAPAAIDSDREKVSKAQALGQNLASDISSEEAEWRPRPVFGFPWIGIDALGYQYGMISVPLMDHMQNETIQLTTLYGVESRYPNIELNFLSTRFNTTWSLDLFRRQTWNGSFRGNTYYFDERGAQISAFRFIRPLQVMLRASYKNSYLLPYIGDEAIWDQIAHGYIRETSLGLSRSDDVGFGSLSYYINSNMATKFDNSNYDYEQTGVGTSLYLPISLFGRTTSQNWGLSYSRVRGERRKLLKEAYRPLRTYVPGTGGGLNEINQPILGPGALTSAVYGDTQARFNFAWSFPVMPDLAKLVHIVYLQRLDFTTFFNYGNAWFHNAPPGPDAAIKAHGYNLDLQADVKGVKLNAGIGVGQVIGNDFEMYALFGFDALINQGDR